MQRIESLPDSYMEILQCAWRAAEPQTVSQMHHSINAERDKIAAKPISYSSVVKSAEHLAEMQWLHKERGQLPAAVYRPVMTREQYVASVMNSVSVRVLGVKVSDALPKLIGRRDRSRTAANRSGGTGNADERAKINALVDAIQALGTESSPSDAG